MEEEGIYYFFKHSLNGHKLVLANTPGFHPGIPYQTRVVYEKASGHTAEEDRVYEWLKTQEIRSGKYVAWDDCFQMPGKHLEARKTIMPSVPVGRVTHKLNAGGNSELEIYDSPGGYAQRFDGVDKGGGDQSGNLDKIFSDNTRTVGIRMQEEALPSLLIHGKGGHAGFTAGHTFDLTEHFSDDGKFVVTSVEHDASQPIGDQAPYEYRNQFQCIPVALPFRPHRTSTIPSIRGVQTGTVVGPSGEEIFTDKYGRVKVQFHWDRQGGSDSNSSCWMRVGTFWAGKQWGAIHIPRIGQEMIVDFVEGDVDRPIIVGSVYNADMMPPYTLPGKKTVSTVKSRSTTGGDDNSYNEFRFEDLKGKEQVFLQAERDEDVRV
jgi:type VI secretion system secreted protein VgrG